MKIKKHYILSLVLMIVLSSGRLNGFGNTLNPVNYIVQRINERTSIKKYDDDILKKYKELDFIINSNYSILDKYISEFKNDFTYTPELKELTSLISADDFYKNKVGLRIDTSVFHLYLSDNYFFAASGNGESVPVDQRLKETLITTYWYFHIVNINKKFIVSYRDYIKGMRIAFIQLDKFMTECIRIYDIADGYEYLGVSSIDAVNSYIQKAVPGLTINQIIDNFVVLQSEIREINASIEKLDSYLKEIQSGIKKVEDKNIFTLKEVDESLEIFYNISNETGVLSRKLASPINNINRGTGRFSKLSEIKQILFIRSVGGLFQYLGKFMSRVDYGNNYFSKEFKTFADNIYKNAQEQYLHSFLFYNGYMKELYNQKFPEIKYIRSIEENIRTYWPEPHNKHYFISYLNTLDDTIQYAIYTDLLLYKHLTDSMLDTIDYFPTEVTLFVYRNALERSNKKQLIGGVKIENVITDYKNVILNFDPENRLEYYKNLEKKTKEISHYYRRAKMVNTLIYLSLFILIAALLIRFIRRKRRWEPYIS